MNEATSIIFYGGPMDGQIMDIIAAGREVVFKKHEGLDNYYVYKYNPMYYDIKSRYSIFIYIGERYISRTERVA